MIEDDLTIGRALLTAFKEEGHQAVWVRLAADVEPHLQAESFDAVLLDLGLPDGDGNAMLKQLRGAGITVPVLIMTARDALQDRLKGFNSGADDYLIKPFDIPELLVRLRAIVRRSGGAADAESQWTLRDLVVEERRMQVTRAGAQEFSYAAL